MADRISQSTYGETTKPGLRTKPYIGTFHSLGATILRHEFRAFGRDANFVIFDDHDSFDLVKKSVKKILPKEEAKASARKKGVPVFFAQRISELKNLPPELFPPKNRPRKINSSRGFSKSTKLRSRETMLLISTISLQSPSIFSKRPICAPKVSVKIRCGLSG